LIAILFLAATTGGMSMQVSASQERDNEDYYSDNKRSGYEEDSKSYYLQDRNSYGQPYGDSNMGSYNDGSYGSDSYNDGSYGSDSYNDDTYSKYPTKEKKVVCKYGPFEGFFVVDKKFCKPPPPPPTPEEDAGLQCEECFKYWMHFLNQQQASEFIDDVAEYINSINFDFTPSQAPGQQHPTCTPVGPDANPSDDVECLPISASSDSNTAAQLFDICEQLELAILWIAERDNVSITEAFETFVDGLIEFIDEGPGSQIVVGLTDCLRERLLPILVEENPQQDNPGPSIQSGSTQQQELVNLKQLIGSLQ
jgi:hypothetical protein